MCKLAVPSIWLRKDKLKGSPAPIAINAPQTKKKTENATLSSLPQ
jgi:hypothetical protein